MEEAGSVRGLRRALLWPVAVAACLRVGLMLVAFARTGTAVMTQGDTASYVSPMLGLLHGAYASGGVPELDRTPGFPVFLLLTGMAGGHVLLCVLCQIALSLLSVLLVSRIAGRVFGSDRAGVIAAWLYACEPLSIVSSVRVMPETLFVLLMLCVLDRLTAYLEDGRLTAVVWAGFALAAATFVRPVSYYLVWPLALGLMLAGPRAGGLRWKAPLALVLCTIPWLAMWQCRNFAVAGYSGFSSIVEKNLYFYQTAEVRAELEDRSLEEEQRLLGYTDEASYVAQHPEQRKWPLTQRLAFMRAESMAVLREHRLLYLKTHLRGMVVVAFTPGPTEFLQLIGAYPDTRSMPRRVVNEGLLASGWRLMGAHPGVVGAMLVFAVPLLFLYGAAGMGLLRGRMAMVLLVAGVGIYFLGISGGAQAVGRYRVPVMPELCVLAAGGLAGLRRVVRRNGET
jgi:4-amino-4-deoxy-L-arabinose transferase-like glycosyltransferase